MADFNTAMLMKVQQFDAEHGDHPIREQPEGNWLVFEDGARRELAVYGVMLSPEYFKPRKLIENKILYQQRLIEVELVPAFDKQKAYLLGDPCLDDDETDAEVAKLKRLQARIRQARAKIANLRLELEAADRPAPSAPNATEDLSHHHRMISETRGIIRFLDGELRIFESRHTVEDADGKQFDPANSPNPGIVKTYSRLVANRQLLAEQEAALAAAVARNNEPPEVRKQRLATERAAERAEEKAANRKRAALAREVKAIEV